MDSNITKLDFLIQEGIIIPVGNKCKFQGEAVGIVKIECESCQEKKLIGHPAYKCSAFGLYGRCLPYLIPANIKTWESRKPESDIYHLCIGCEKFYPETVQLTTL